MCLNLAISLTLITYRKTCDFAHASKQAIEHVPLEAFATGSIAGVLGRLAFLQLDPARLSSQRKNLSMVYRYTPMWGLRMAVYTSSSHYFLRGHEKSSPLVQAPCFALAGMWTEFWTRLITNPVNRVRLCRDWQIEAGKQATFASEVRRIWAERGVVGYMEGCPSFRVEMVHMGVFFGVYHTLRNLVVLAMGDPEATIVNRIPADAIGGAVGAACATAASHGMRNSVMENQTMRSKSYFVATGMKEAMQHRIPLAAFVVALHGVLFHVLAPKHKDRGLSGWEVQEEHRHSRYQ